jgi:hydrogenase nickel incorporation protein HypA/HybF
MHELAIARQLVELLEEHAERERADRITRVRVEVGQMSGVVAEALEFCFEIAARGSRAEGAALELSETPAVVRCLDCGEESQPGAFSMICAHCAGLNTELVAGRELLLREIEVVRDV